MLTEMSDEAEFPSDVSEVQCIVEVWVELKVSVVPLYELLGVLFINSVESQLTPTPVVAVSLSNAVVNFSISEKGETVTKAVTICADSSVASSIVENGETSATAAIVDFTLG